MSLADFHVAVDMLAGKKYPGDPSGAEKIRAKLTSVEGPSIDGTTVKLVACIKSIIILFSTYAVVGAKIILHSIYCLLSTFTSRHIYFISQWENCVA